MHLTLGILRQSQAVFYALSFLWLDGFAVPAPAQVTQTVRPFFTIVMLGRIKVLIEQSETLGNFLFIALWVSLFADFILRGAWNKTYFTIGLPIFIKRFPVNGQFKGIPFQNLFNEETQNEWVASFVFKAIDARSYGLREKFFRPRYYRYIPLMHGVMVFENDKEQVTVKGMANLFTLWLALYFLLSLLNLLKTPLTDIAGLIAFVIFVIVVTYFMQSSVFSEIGKFAANLCTKKHFLNNGGV